MGFGRGILEEPRRTVALLAGVGPFGEVVSPWGTSVTVVTPAGTPPFRPPEPHAAPVFPHEADPHGVVPRVGEPQPRRTLISDTRDLLVQTLYRKTRLVDTDLSGAARFAPLLPCEVEGPETWTRTPATANVLPGYIHIGRTTPVEGILQHWILEPTRRRLKWDGRLDSLDKDGYVILMAAGFDPPGRHLICAQVINFLSRS